MSTNVNPTNATTVNHTFSPFKFKPSSTMATKFADIAKGPKGTFRRSVKKCS
jgi:hypothetical protein